MRTGTRSQVFIDGRYISKDTWYDADGKPFQPQVHYFVGGATKLYGAALYRLRPQDFGELKHVDGISPAWPLTYDDFEPYYTKAEWLYQVHGNHGEDPIEGHWSKQYPWPAVSHEPRIQQLSDDLAAARLPPVPRAVRHPARRGRPGREHVHPLHVVRRLPVPGAREVRRRDDRRAARARPADNVTLLVNAEVVKLETDPSGRTVTGVVVVRDGERETYAGRHRRRCRRAPSNSAQDPARLGERPAPERPRERLRPGRAQLHVPQQQGGRRAVEGAERHALPEDARRERLLLRRTDDYDFPVGHIQMVGKSNAEAMKGEEPALTKLAPHWTLADDRPARGRLLAHDRGPARARQPGHARRRRQRPPVPTRRHNDEEADRLYHELKKILNHVGHGRAPRAATRTSTCT